ncbi:MAG TPA: polymer-forming cytoskeletal protein [Vicinamibacterales bacterium]|nr:polymer-forming cytoskeletal protein [Vicinamibacterales bacterium]
MNSTTGALTIKGELSAREDVTIDGVFEGEIDLDGHQLIAGARSRVTASVLARVITVLGHLDGHLTADLVDIGPAARVDATVVAKQMSLEEGALFNGSVNTERARAAREVARHRNLKPKA